MPILPVVLPALWDIPVAAGVPALLGQSASAGASAVASTTLGTVLEDYAIAAAASQWGLYDASGNRVLTCAHVRALDFESMSQISDAPQLNGAFVSYDKVRMPRRLMVEMVCDGSDAEGAGLLALPTQVIGSLSGGTAQASRAAFLATLEAMVDDVGLYAVVTPEITCPSVNVIGHRYRRESRDGGVSMLVAQVMVQEVRVAATQQYATTRQPQGAASMSLGTVQAVDVAG
ncbi:hypothetical protein [Novacetimonas pomaceti]|uniref:hypothetical protein n=1 Tax=Novacetimonas pomaceti TaxID=2021998 RepID=UPI001C2CE214|nr:hypothetical protein [Novacetimonas pomaceti]MBV1834636.1 hypothetical protein [Novacetimonas pomaceti]